MEECDKVRPATLLFVAYPPCDEQITLFSVFCL